MYVKTIAYKTGFDAYADVFELIFFVYHTSSVYILKRNKSVNFGHAMIFPRVKTSTKIMII